MISIREKRSQQKSGNKRTEDQFKRLKEDSEIITKEEEKENIKKIYLCSCVVTYSDKLEGT